VSPDTNIIGAGSANSNLLGDKLSDVAQPRAVWQADAFEVRPPSRCVFVRNRTVQIAAMPQSDSVAVGR